jgi:hypothetical protein
MDLQPVQFVGLGRLRRRQDVHRLVAGGLTRRQTCNANGVEPGEGDALGAEDGVQTFNVPHPVRTRW